jgi:YVTN family beta-propeller protein
MFFCCALMGCGNASEPSREHSIIVSNENAGTITVIDAASNRVRATIPVGKRPRGLRVSKDGSTVYVALSGSAKGGPGVDEASLPPPDRSADGIGVVDLQAGRLVRVIPSGPDPEAFDLSDDGMLVVSNEDAAQASIVDLDDATIRARVSVGEEPEGVTRAPDGTFWVTSEADHSVTAIDASRGVVVASIPTGLRPRAIAFTRDNKLGLVTNEADATLTLFSPAERKAIATIKLPAVDGGMPPRPMGIVLSPKQDRAYVTTGRAGGVAVIDLAGRSVITTIRNAGARPWGIACAPNGLLYTANGPSDDVSVIDPGTNTVLARIASAGGPWGVAVTP